MIVVVTDPTGFKHWIEFDDHGGTYGHENLAHVLPACDRDGRKLLTNDLLDRMQRSATGSYRGFKWCKSIVRES